MFEVTLKNGHRIKLKQIDSISFSKGNEVLNDGYLRYSGEIEQSEDELQLGGVIFDRLDWKDVKSITWREEKI